MPIAEARIPTDRASRYLIQLCRHADHMRSAAWPPVDEGAGRKSPGVDHVDYCDTAGTVQFADGQLSMRASADALTLRVEAADDDALRRLQDGVAARLHKIGRRDQLTTIWHRPQTSAAAPDFSPDDTDSADPGAKRRWWDRLGTMGLVTGGAVIVALHLGLGGAALAASPWLGGIGNIVLVIIVVKVVFIASHVILGYFGFRRGKALHARWKSRHAPPDPTPAPGERPTSTPEEHP